MTWEATVKTLVKDGLMPFFFLVVGLELKHEMFDKKEAQGKARIVLPLVAAFGGMIVPALLYILMTFPHPELQKGWAIPAATDIAFALCVLTLAGKNAVPPAVKVFLLAIAIYDDLAAILVVALFYSQGLSLLPMLGAALIVGLLILCNLGGVGRPSVYVFLGILLAVMLSFGGIHSTVAGVITGFAIPLRGHTTFCPHPLKEALHGFHSWVTFGILPLFAFVSAGVSFSGLPSEAFLAPLPIAVALALCMGKPIGIVGTVWAAHRWLKLPLPEQARWRDILGISCLAGIGFTMSLFIGGLAFSEPLLQEKAKIGTMAGSVLATVFGLTVLKCRKP
jgi:NhaA family Na+:H+ antiporter